LKYEYVIFHAMSRSLNMVIKYKAKAITFKAKALNTPRYQTNIPGINYSLLSSGSNMTHLVLISYYIALLILNVLHISEHQAQPF